MSEEWHMKSGLPKPGGLAWQLWEEAEQIANESLHCPFVIAMAQGTLSKVAFQHYVAQNSNYLQFFARSYALAMSKCDPALVSDEHYQQLGHMLRGVHEELRLHESYAKRWGVEMNGIHASPATRAYTDFVMEVANDPRMGVAEILAAMAPCARLYGYIGCRLAAGLPGIDHAYKDWVETYSSDSYLEIPVIKEEMMETIAKSSGSDVGTLQRLYTRAMQLEVDFFCAQPAAPPARAISLVAVDFDDTCTPKDTITNLMSAAVDAQAAAAGAGAGADGIEEVRNRLAATNAQLSANYLSQFEAFLARALPATPAVAYDAVRLSDFLSQLSDFDASMNDVVEAAGVLAGLTPSQLIAAGKGVALRHGCRAMLQRLLASGVPTHIVSVNWSATYVASALGLPLLPHPALPTAAPPAASPDNLIVANELEVGPGGATTGRIKRAVQGARDKGAAFDALAAGTLTADKGHGGASVFVGDSASDLAALLKADYGIVIGSNKTLRRVAAAFGVTLAPLVSAPLDKQLSGRGVLYEVGSWGELEAFVCGPRCYEGYPYKAEMARLRRAWATTGLTTPARDIRGAASTSVAGKEGGGNNAPFVPRVLTVAGSDSGGGAGIQADLKAFLANGVFGMSAVTALTAQNTHGVQGVHVAPLEFIGQQLDSVLGDLGTDAIKTGMLPSADVVELVGAKIKQWGVSTVVVDPVMISTSGHSLADGTVAGALLRTLMPLATLVTPNLPEASALLGGREIESVADMETAARELVERGHCRAVLIKGGHLVGPLRRGGEEEVQCATVTDVLYDGHELHRLSSPTVYTRNTHGTGCTLASAIAAHLAHGLPLLAAVTLARDYLHTCLRSSVALQLGSGAQPPFNHGWALADWQAEAGKGGAGGCGRLDPAAVRRAMALYAVTDAGLNKKLGRSLKDAVADAIRGGATIVQVREKDVEGGDFLRAAREAAEVCAAARVPLVINDRVDIALALGPGVGVHVGQSDLPATVVRSLLGPGRLLGVSVKTADEAARAVRDGADYLGCGAICATSTKDSSVIGVEGLAVVCKAVAGTPVVAIGGVGAHNAEELIMKGHAAGIAVVSAIFGQQDAVAAARNLRHAVDAALDKAAAADGPQANGH